MARKTQTTSHLAQSRQCGKPQLHKCPKYSACHAPHTTDLHQMLWRATENDTLTMPHACHAFSRFVTTRRGLTMSKKHAARHVERAAHATQNMKMASKVLSLPRKCKSPSENLAKVLHLSHKTTRDTFSNRSECHEVPHLPHKTP